MPGSPPRSPGRRKNRGRLSIRVPTDAGMPGCWNSLARASPEAAKRPDGGPRKRRRGGEMRRLAEVDEVGQRAGGGVTPGKGRQIPLQLDGGQDRCVIVDNRRDMAWLGERRGDQARDAEPVAVVTPGLVRRNMNIGRNVVRGNGRRWRHVIVEAASLVPDDDE